jgi:hypothetical protein
MKDWRAQVDTNQGFDIHQHLCATKHHETEMTATDRFQRRAWTQMKWRNWHSCSVPRFRTNGADERSGGNFSACRAEDGDGKNAGVNAPLAGNDD